MTSHEPLETQLETLKTACREYDEGNRSAALRMATSFRTLFHDSKDSPSLLTQLGSHFVRLLSTAVKRPDNLTAGHWPSLVQYELNVQESLFYSKPKLNATKSADRLVAFKFWWSEEAIYQFEHKKIRRKDLVLAASFQAGDTTSHDYSWLVSGSGWKVTLRPDQGPQRDVTLQDAHLATLRQIAHEVLNSPELLKLAKP